MPLTQVQGQMLNGSNNTTTTIQSNGTTAITIDSSQNVGIGTSSPSGRLNLAVGASTACTLRLTSNNTGSGSGDRCRWDNYSADNSGVAYQLGFIDFDRADGTGTSSYMAIQTRVSGTVAERMRVTSGGNLFIGTTSGYSQGERLAISYDYLSGTGIVVDSGAGAGAAMRFRTNGSLVGSITTGTSTTAYNTSSDYRLKENIAPMQNALGVVSQLKPVTYNWKVDGSAGQGFIAHELQAVVPDAVTGEKDAVDEKGNIKPQGIDTSFLVATLTAAIQELKTELDATKAEVAELKAKGQ